MACHQVIHVGDTHGRTDERSADQYASLDAAIERGEALSRAGTLAAWAWPGDLFHAVTEAADRNALQLRAQRMAQIAPVVIVRGNHDGPGELDVFGRLRARFPIYVSQQPEVLAFESATGVPVRVFTLPYPNKAALVAAGTPSHLVSQAARAALDGIVAYGSAELAREPGAIQFVAGHGNTSGARSSAGQPQIGQEIEFDAAMFDRFGPHVYIALNHIHAHQAVGRGVFAGSLCRLDFGELEPKGIIVATFGAADAAYGGDPLADGVMRFLGWQFEPLDVRAMYHIEGQLTPDGFTYHIARAGGEPVGQTFVPSGLIAIDPLPEGAPAGIRAGDGASWRGADVRVRYTYCVADLPRLNVALIHAEFAEARTLKIEKIPDRQTEVRAPDVLAATTVPDKLRAFAVREGVAWTDDLAVIMSNLETQPVDRWQTDVLAEIAGLGADVIGS